MKGKIFTVAGRTLIRTMIVSVFVAAVLALGTPARASLRAESAHATHKAAPPSAEEKPDAPSPPDALRDRASGES